MKLVWRPEAHDDRDRIMDRISQDNPVAAADLDEIKGKSLDSARPCTERAGLKAHEKSLQLLITSSST